MLTQFLGRVDSASPRLLETVRHLYIIGGHMPPSLAKQASQVLTPNIWTGYGSTEAGQVSVGEVSLSDSTISAGRLVPWIEVEIVDETLETPLGTGQEGVLRVRGPSVAQSYYRDAAVTAQYFRNGWFYPGDIAVLSSDRQLRILGRTDEMMNLGGRKIAPVAIETRLRGLSAVLDVAVFPLDDSAGAERIGAAVVLRPDATLEQVRVQAGEALGGLAPYALLALPSLPRNTMGKVLKRALIAMIKQRQAG